MGEVVRSSKIIKVKGRYNMTNKKYQSAKEYEMDLYEVLKEFVQGEEKITPENLLKIKKVTHGIHTHVTYLMGEKFLKHIAPEVKDNFKYDEMCNNGFDIELPYGNSQIVAEIKGNMPVCNNETTYGANQRNSIIKDINYLIYGKNKSEKYKPENGVPLKSLEKAYRFLILLKNNEEAIHTHIKNLPKDDFLRFHFPKELCWKEFSNNSINVIFIDL